MSRQENCKECRRGPSSFEGCSHIVCPQRKIVTAQPVGDPFIAKGNGVIRGIIGNDGVRRLPTNDD